MLPDGLSQSSSVGCSDVSLYYSTRYPGPQALSVILSHREDEGIPKPYHCPVALPRLVPSDWSEWKPRAEPRPLLMRRGTRIQKRCLEGVLPQTNGLFFHFLQRWERVDWFTTFPRSHIANIAISSRALGYHLTHSSEWRSWPGRSLHYTAFPDCCSLV